MRTVRILLVLCVLYLAGASDAVAQDSKGGVPAVVQRSDDRSLRVNLSTHSKAKIFFSRNRYRVGELVKVDVALRLSNRTEYYFARRFEYRIIIKDSSGAPITIKSIFNVDARPRYEKLANTVLTQSAYLILGCNDPAIVSFAKSIDGADLDDPDWLFENNVFDPPADACVDIQSPGTFDVSVEVMNDEVVTPVTQDGIPTLVGSVRGPAFRITIER